MIYEGEVGENLTIYCPVHPNKEVLFVYLQKGDVFVNGYDSTRPVFDTWPNTRMDRNNSAIILFDLNISHAGEYKCYIRYKDEPVKIIKQHLSVTGM